MWVRESVVSMYSCKVLFYWVGSDHRRAIRRGWVWASDAEDVRSRLRKARVIPLRVGISRSMFLYPLWWWQQLQHMQQAQQLSAGQLGLFFRSLHTLLKEGMSPYQALSVLAQQGSDRRLQGAIRAVVVGIERGLLLGDAFNAAQSWWPQSIIVAVVATQTSGMLDRVCSHLADTCTLQQQVSADLTTVLMVPLITAGAAVLVLGWAAQFCASSLSTQHSSGFFWVFIECSRFVAAYGIYVMIGIGVSAHALVRSNFSIPLLSRAISTGVLSVPLWGPIIAAGHSIVFFMIIAVLLRAGAPIVTALTAVAAVHPNRYWRFVLSTMIDRLSAGWSLYEVMRAAPRVCIPDYFVQMLPSVLSAAHLAGVCEAAAELLRHERSQRLRRSIALVQPVLMISIGSMIAYFISIMYESLSQSMHSIHFL